MSDEDANMENMGEEQENMEGEEKEEEEKEPVNPLKEDLLKKSLSRISKTYSKNYKIIYLFKKFNNYLKNLRWSFLCIYIFINC